jgi:hypothetical protein
VLCRVRRLFALVHLLKPHLIIGATMLSTSAVRLAGGFDDRNYREDMNLAQILVFLGPVEILPGPGRRYRQHEDSLSRSATASDIHAGYVSGWRLLAAHPHVRVWPSGCWGWRGALRASRFAPLRPRDPRICRRRSRRRVCFGELSEPVLDGRERVLERGDEDVAACPLRARLRRAAASSASRGDRAAAAITTIAARVEHL